MVPSPPLPAESPANVLFGHPRRTEPDVYDGQYRDDGGTAHLTVTVADEEPPLSANDEIDGEYGLLTVGNVLTDDTVKLDLSSGSVITDSIPDPTDLSTIGIAISRFCKYRDDNGEDITVCFDSFDTLLRRASSKLVFQFAHVLVNRLSSVDAYAHFHFDPTDHEDQIISTFETTFDEVVVEDWDSNSFSEATDEDVAARLAKRDDHPALDSKPAVDAEDTADTLGN